jgi:hypothetical protein
MTKKPANLDHILQSVQGLDPIVSCHYLIFDNLNSNVFVAYVNSAEQEKRLALLWSAKNALYKCVVKIQGELQPLRDSKSRGDRLGTVLKEKIFEALGRRKKTVTRILKTFCDRRKDYLQNHAPDQLNLPENQDIAYAEFTKLQLDDSFWNNGYMCMSKAPWAIDSTVRTGIHAMLRLNRADEELTQLAFELRRCLSWGVWYCEQLKHWIDQCVLGLSQQLICVPLRM